MADKRAEYQLGTKSVQAGWQPGNGEPRQLPIIQSTTFKYETSEQMADLFDLKASGYFYSRLQNPTTDSVAGKITELEGGAAGMLTSSGQAANFFAVINLAQAGDHIVSVGDIYGGSYNLFNVTLRKFGIETTFVDVHADEEELQAAFQDNTKLVFGETVSNPTGYVLDIEKFAHVAHKNGVPLIIDNTLATPINCRPMEFGADIVTHSTTKYIDGHGATIGGAIIDSGKFDWTANDKFPGFTEPDESYHGLVFAEAFGEAAYITKATVTLMRDLGATQSPQTAFYLNSSLESLHLRMPRHVENATKLAEFLEAHDKVAWVKYSGLKSSSEYNLAQKYMPNGTTGVLAFGLKGGRDAAVDFMKHLDLFAIATHLADSRSCVLHPASHTHRQLSEEELKEVGISPDLIRLSVGVEDSKDIIADVSNALDQLN